MIIFKKISLISNDNYLFIIEKCHTISKNDSFEIQ